MSRGKQKQRQRKHRRQQNNPRAGAAKQRKAPAAFGSIDLQVRHPELAHPPVYVDSMGTRIVDPFARLGLDPRAPVTPEAVQSAFRAALADAPPEQDSQAARELVEARKVLLDPKQALTRTLGDLRVPRAEHFVPGTGPQRAPSAPREATTMTDWSARSRLVAIMTLYALLEEELEGKSAPGAQTGLLFE